MTHNTHSELVGLIWNIANKLRGPYRPPQYRKVMIPMIVLRRLDCVLEENHEKVLKKYEQLKEDGKLNEEAIDKMLAKVASTNRKHPLFNKSKYTFRKLLADPDNIARNLVDYIHGFSPKAKEIFQKFKFEEEIEKLDEVNRLYMIVKEFANPEDGVPINLHPDRISNLQMGYVFEELVRKFNEQANEEAGDHFTPREVIRLMASLIYTDEEDVYKSGIIRSIYDPTCGTGGMLSVSEEHIRAENMNANLLLYGQEYNDESYAICCSDLLIKDEPLDHIIHGDTLGDGKTFDGHPDKKFHYMMANPPFGVEWKPQKDTVNAEHDTHGFSGRFGPGLPRINDGALLFLLHMISKMYPSPELGGDGSKIAVVFNGSPLFTGDAASGESNIRRWIIENDMLDAVVALPNQLFYNTGIFTYIWLVTNKKPAQRKGKIQLIDATKHYRKMDKSLGDKRNLMSDDHIKEITRLYGENGHDAVSQFLCEGKPEEKIASKIFDNRDFGYLKMVVERPLRLNFFVNDERIAKLKDENAFLALAESKKRKSQADIEKEVAEGKALQQSIIVMLEGMKSDELIMDRAIFLKSLKAASKAAGLKLEAPVQKAIVSALSEKDQIAEICYDSKGKPEPDADLRDTELVPLPDYITLPLPIDYDKKAKNDRLLLLVEDHCEAYLKKEVLPHVPDAWIDHKKTKVGYEIPLNRHFYEYVPPRDLDLIEQDIEKVENEILGMLKDLNVS
ncbi:class I SAM-dependent DNA methyltransferase [Marinifilum fragile]|uniref:type I restriction-modification system subunit M n=1 Tax=Marinifilum fragile TaxID=570161 RepID=UPI002AA86B5B|nr:class I SAM-dependent DNA methyltransferase [Marinifilum fragile]